MTSTGTSSSLAPTLRELLADKGASLALIATHLDALDPATREREVTSLSGSEQRRVWEMSADAAPIDLQHFVPSSIGDLVPVHHAGRNTIPSPTYFQRFQKRFTRPRGDTTRLFGYNASNASFVHPGYFVAYSTAGHDEWKARGSVVIDYHLVPDGDVPEGWPKVVANSVGLQRLVYYKTRDFMRRVSKHMSIGRASRHDGSGDRELDFWFTLCRLDVAGRAPSSG